MVMLKLELKLIYKCNVVVISHICRKWVWTKLKQNHCIVFFFCWPDQWKNMPQTLYVETVTITYNGMLIVIHIYASDFMFMLKLNQ